MDEVHVRLSGWQGPILCVATVLMLLPIANVVSADEPSTAASESENQLWKQMLDGGLITQEQYEQALKTGGLGPIGEGRSENPLVGRRARTERRVLRYEKRREKIRRNLGALAKRLREKQTRELDEAHRKARALGISIRETFANGGGALLVRFEDGKPPEYLVTDNVNAAKTISTDQIQSGATNGFSLDGSCVTIGIWDVGTVRSTHQEFDSRAHIRENITNESDHATGVAGTLAAGGTNGQAKGMAFACSVDSYYLNLDVSEMASAASNGLHVSNHSYSRRCGWDCSQSIWYWRGWTYLSQDEDYNFGRYDDVSRAQDEVVAEALYYLPVFSASNNRSEGPTNQPVPHYSMGSGLGGLRHEQHNGARFGWGEQRF